MLFISTFAEANPSGKKRGVSSHAISKRLYSLRSSRMNCGVCMCVCVCVCMHAIRIHGIREVNAVPTCSRMRDSIDAGLEQAAGQRQRQRRRRAQAERACSATSAASLLEHDRKWNRITETRSLGDLDIEVSRFDAIGDSS